MKNREMLPLLDITGLDEGIKPVVMLLRDHGFITFESCEGGEGHCFTDPTVYFEGNEHDGRRAYEICEVYGFNVKSFSLVFRKDSIYLDEQIEKGSVWNRPFISLEFAKHPDTGTIYRP